MRIQVVFSIGVQNFTTAPSKTIKVTNPLMKAFYFFQEKEWELHLQEQSIKEEFQGVSIDSSQLILKSTWRIQSKVSLN